MNASDTHPFPLRRRSIQPLGLYKCASTTVDGCSASSCVFILSVVGGCCCLIFRRLFAAAAAAADHMECRPLEVTVILARDLRDVGHIFDPYVVASLSGGERHSNEQRTPAHRDGGTRPRWNHALAVPFTVDVAAARAGLLTLKLKIKTERTLGGDKDVGWVDVPVRELLDQGGDVEPRAMSYDVRLPQSGSTGGVLEFSYKFGELFTVRGGAPDQPPANQQPPMAGGRSVGGLIIGTAIKSAVSTAIKSAMPNALSDDEDM